MGVVVGIDLGTTHTVVAAMVDGKPVALADEGTSPLIPSVVSFLPSGAVLVGSAASERRLTDPQNTIYSVKRLLGRTWDTEEVQKARERFAFALEEGPGHATLAVAHGESYTLAELSAFVLRKAKSIAELVLGDAVDRAVITVPANFNDLQRSATKVAARVAGIEVVRIINEPTAAALAYGSPSGSPEKLAVFDFGGGTFDITILSLVAGVYEVMATAGDTFLGGDDIDLSVATELGKQVRGRYDFDALATAEGRELLRQAAETVKHRLSKELSATVDLDTATLAGCPHSRIKLTLSRTDFERLALPWVNRTFAVCEQALDIARVTPKDIHRVLLVGGSTMMPIVQQRVASFFGRPGESHDKPTEVVALGAALQAAALTAAASTKEVPVPPPPMPRGALSPAVPATQAAPPTPSPERSGGPTSPGLGMTPVFAMRPTRIAPPTSADHELSPVTVDMADTAQHDGPRPKQPSAAGPQFASVGTHRAPADTLTFGDAPDTLSGLGPNATKGPRRPMVRVSAGTTPDATEPLDPESPPTTKRTTLVPSFAAPPADSPALPALAPQEARAPKPEFVADLPELPLVGVGVPAPAAPPHHSGRPLQADQNDGAYPTVISFAAEDEPDNEPTAIAHRPARLVPSGADTPTGVAPQRQDIVEPAVDEPTGVIIRPAGIAPPTLDESDLPVVARGRADTRRSLSRERPSPAQTRPAITEPAPRKSPLTAPISTTEPTPTLDAELRARYGNLPLIVGGKRVGVAPSDPATGESPTPPALPDTRSPDTPGLPAKAPAASLPAVARRGTFVLPSTPSEVLPQVTAPLTQAQQSTTNLPDLRARPQQQPPARTLARPDSPATHSRSTEPTEPPPSSGRPVGIASSRGDRDDSGLPAPLGRHGQPPPRYGSLRPSAHLDPNEEAALPIPDVPPSVPSSPAPESPLRAPPPAANMSLRGVAPPPPHRAAEPTETGPLQAPPPRRPSAPLGPSFASPIIGVGIASPPHANAEARPALPVSPQFSPPPPQYLPQAPSAGTLHAPSSSSTSAARPLLIDVTPLSLCVETAGGFADVLLARNTPVPCERTREFAPARDNQDMVRIRVAQGEGRMFSENVLLGEVQLSNLRPAQRDQVRLAITFLIDSDGILHVKALDTTSGQAAQADLRLAGAPTATEIARMTARQSLRPTS